MGLDKLQDLVYTVQSEVNQLWIKWKN
jgi:hypothetical protein